MILECFVSVRSCKGLLKRRSIVSGSLYQLNAGYYFVSSDILIGLNVIQPILVRSEFSLSHHALVFFQFHFIAPYKLDTMMKLCRIVARDLIKQSILTEILHFETRIVFKPQTSVDPKHQEFFGIYTHYFCIKFLLKEFL